MENKQFEPSYWIIIRNNKKYLGCQNNCKHLEDINNKIVCSYFGKEIKGIEDNYKPCKECFNEFCHTHFDIQDLVLSNKNHFEE